MKRLSLDWTRHLAADKKADFEKVVRNNTLLLERLYDILDEWEQEIKRAETNVDQYDTSSWAFLQAHRNGHRQFLNKAKDLVGFFKDK